MDSPLASFMKQFLEESRVEADSVSIATDPGNSLKRRTCRWTSTPMRESSFRMDESSSTTYSMVRRNGWELDVSDHSDCSKPECCPRKPIRRASSESLVSLMKMRADCQRQPSYKNLAFPQMPKRRSSKQQQAIEPQRAPCA